MQSDGSRTIQRFVVGFNTKLPDPHYTNDYFKTARTVFGKEQKGLEYSYSDRLPQWDNESYQRGREKALESEHTTNSPAWYEVLLKEFFTEDIKLVHVLAGFNLSSGYPYYVFGVIMPKEAPEEVQA